MGFFCILAMMNLTFGQPIFLWGLLSIGVPIGLHFFNKKNKSTLFFSDIRVLKGVPTKGKGIRQIKDLLLLTFRILALCFLILAFSQPKINGFLNHQTPNTYLYVDNHLGLLEGNRSAFNSLASELPRSKNPIFLLLNPSQSSDFESKSWFDVREMWQNMPFSDRVGQPKSILDRIRNVEAEQNAVNPAKIIWVSDFFRSNSWPKFPENAEVHLIPIKAPVMSNIIVDSIWHNTNQIQRGQAFNLKVRIKNVGNAVAMNQKMSLYLDDFPISTEEVYLKVGQAKWLDFAISLSDKSVIKAKLVSEDKVVFDNVYSFTLAIPDSKDVYVVDGMSEIKYFSKVFLNDSLFDFHAMNKQNLMLNLSKISGVLILNDLLSWSDDALKMISKWVKMGNTLVFSPGIQLNPGMILKLNSIFSSQGNLFKLANNNAQMAVRIPIKNSRFFNAIIERSSLKKNLDMFNARPSLQWNGGDPIFEYMDGKPFLSQFKLGTGYMYVFSTDIAKDSDSFIQHGLFLPVFQEMALSNSKKSMSTDVFSNNFNLIPPKSFKFYKATNKDLMSLEKGSQSWIPQQKWTGKQWTLQWPDFVERNFSGFWQVKNRDKKWVDLAINYPNEESEMRSYSVEEIQNHYRGKQHIQVGGMKDIRVGGELPSDLSFYFFMASLCFFLIEMAMVFGSRLKITPELRK